MIKVLTAAQMQACDRAAIEEYRIPGAVLMENAGLQTAEAIVERFDGPPLSTLVLCGRGNNGGDGFVIARHLHNLGGEVVIHLLGDPEQLTGDARVNHDIAAAMGIAIATITEEAAWDAVAAGLSGFDCIVDAMLGTGIDSAARGVIAEAIDSVNGSGVPVVAVDVPSGLSSDSGTPPGRHIVADLTVTFAAPKLCHVLAPASAACGDLEVVEISIPQAVMRAADATLRLLTPEDVAGRLLSRSRDAHKGTFGTVLVIGGAPGTAGAAVLSAEAALRGGAGLVHVACPRSVWSMVGAQLTEALVHPIDAGRDGGIGLDGREALERHLLAADVLAIGPGIGSDSETVEIVDWLAGDASQPAVIDADGLNALVGRLDRIAGASAPRILTPHPGEMARLLDTDTATVQSDRPAAVAALVERTGAVVVLKGHRTLIGAPGEVTIVNPTGNPGMATGGTGDVLTGLIAALLAQGMEPLEAAWFGAWTHGLAGDLAALERGEISLVAGDLIEWLPRALQDPAAGGNA